MLTIVLSVLCLSFICWPLCCLSPACSLYVDHCVVCPLLVLYMLTIVLSVPYLFFICWPLRFMSPACPLYVDHCVLCPLLALYMLTIVLSVLLQYTVSDYPSYFYITAYFVCNLSTPLSTIFSNIIRGNRFYTWRKSEYPKKKSPTYSKSLTQFIT
jgi:hypothetical protein